MSLGSLLFESEQTTGYFLRRAHDFRVGGSGVVIAGFECLVVGDETRGKIDELKGYGFIQPQDGGKDVFVHISAVERAGLSSLNEGQQVEYEIVSNRGKSSAENLKVK